MLVSSKSPIARSKHAIPVLGELLQNAAFAVVNASREGSHPGRTSPSCIATDEVPLPFVRPYRMGLSLQSR